MSYDFSDEDFGASNEDDSSLQREVLLREIMAGQFRLVYAHPEAFLSTTQGYKMLQSDIFKTCGCCIAIDEAHMIDEW